MSDSEEIQRKWWTQGSLRFLATKLKVTAKQITRYWDTGLIPGRYRTRKGHRRIRYDDCTVERVALAVQAAKETNLAIRYHIPSIDYCGTIVPVKGCTKMHDVYVRALQAGLNDRDARNAAYRRRSANIEPTESDLTREYLLRVKGTSENEVREVGGLFALVPLESLIQPCDAKTFRAKARSAWRDVLSDLKASAGWDGFPRSSQEGDARRKKIRDAIRPLFHQPDFVSFRLAWNKAFELENRIMDHEDETYLRVEEEVRAHPNIQRLRIAAISLKHSGQSPSVTALAKTYGISRPALYRAFKLEEIRAALRILRNDTQAIHETRNHMQTKAKKSNRVAADLCG